MNVYSIYRPYSMIYQNNQTQKLIRIPYLDLTTATNASYWVLPRNISYEIAMYVIMSDFNFNLIIHVVLYKTVGQMVVTFLFLYADVQILICVIFA